MPFAPVYENLLASSFFLWLDHTLISNGGYINVSSKFYPINTNYNGLTTLSAPYNQLIFDSSVPGVNVMTGVYYNGSPISIGQSGFQGINYDKGQIYFNTSLNGVTISGNYAVKEFNTSLPKSDLKLIFEGKMSLKPKTTINLATTGLRSDEMAFPVILARNEGGNNVPYCFGGTDLTTTKFGCFVFSDSQFKLDCVQGILKDQKMEFIPIFSTGEMPTNNIGSLKNNVLFNYTGITAMKVANGSGIWIKDVTITDFTRRGLFQEVENLSNDVFFGVAEFELCKNRLT